MSSYSLSLPLESRHFRNEMDASTFAGEYVFGSFNSEIILSRIVLNMNTVTTTNNLLYKKITLHIYVHSRSKYFNANLIISK